MSRTRMLRTAAVAGLPLLLLGSVALRPVPKAHFSGTTTLHYTEQHAMPLGDQSQPMLLQNKAEGSNRNTGPTDYMDGAEIASIEIADLTRGNGTHQGYISLSKDREATLHRWRGTVKTVLAADGKTAVTTFEAPGPPSRGPAVTRESPARDGITGGCCRLRTWPLTGKASC